MYSRMVSSQWKECAAPLRRSRLDAVKLGCGARSPKIGKVARAYRSQCLLPSKSIFSHSFSRKISFIKTESIQLNEGTKSFSKKKFRLWKSFWKWCPTRPIRSRKTFLKQQKQLLKNCFPEVASTAYGYLLQPQAQSGNAHPPYPQVGFQPSGKAAKESRLTSVSRDCFMHLGLLIR